MLNFKMGKHYKDTDGDLWRFCGYVKSSERANYYFQSNKNRLDIFHEQQDNSVTEWTDGRGVKIPFVEEKEREWVIGEEYECFDAVTQRVIKARLTKIIKKTDSHLVFIFHVNGLHFDFHFEGIVLVMGRYVIFKDGVPQELKDRLNKSKLTNKQKCFQKGQVYKTNTGKEYIFKRRIKTKNNLFVIFEDDKGWVCIDELFRLNNIECVPLCASNGMFLCADESIRNENTNKAVRVMQ